MTELLHANLTYQLRGLAFHIHNELRGGHEEAVYEAALSYALESAGVPFMRQPVYHVAYRNQQVGEYRPDFVLADGGVVVELKATPAIEPLHKAQTISYLAVTGAALGVIMNFGGELLQVERIPNFLGRRVAAESILATPDAETSLYAQLTNDTLDALGYVHRTLGPGFLHQVYRRATRIELAHRRIKHDYLKELPLRYNGHVIKMTPVRLLLIENKLLLATVALKSIATGEVERMRWAMKLVGAQLGVIVNFYGTRIEPQFVRGKQ
jgi:GxxExxY protein